VAAASLLITASCGGSGDDSSDDATEQSTSQTTAATAETELQALVDAATAEGHVTLYSSQLPANLEAFASAFEDRYPGIEVDALRMLDQDMGPRIEAERTNGGADMYVSAAEPAVIAFAESDTFAPPTAPGFDSDLAEFVNEGGYFEVGAALLVPAWNTNLLPQGLDSLEDLLDPALGDGRIGLPDPTAASFVDMYLYLEEEFGDEFLEQLGAQAPRMYPSATAAGQAVVAGEISVAAFAPPPITDMANGAPVDYVVPDSVWGARYFGAVLNSAPNPNAGQLLAHFMMSPEGQELINRDFSAIYPDVPGTLTDNRSVRRQDVELLTPEFVTEFAARWAALRQ
jgi:iron(III) transport system substrate-binding protein